MFECVGGGCQTAAGSCSILLRRPDAEGHIPYVFGSKLSTSLSVCSTHNPIQLALTEDLRHDSYSYSYCSWSGFKSLALLWEPMEALGAELTL